MSKRVGTLLLQILLHCCHLCAASFVTDAGDTLPSFLYKNLASNFSANACKFLYKKLSQRTWQTYYIHQSNVIVKQMALLVIGKRHDCAAYLSRLKISRLLLCYYCY